VIVGIGVPVSSAPSKIGRFSRGADSRGLDCILLASVGMPLATCRWRVLASASLLFVASAARAEDPWKPPPHLRPQTTDARQLVAEATRRSASIRDMVDRLERSDVIVYIRHRVFAESGLEGWIGILSTAAGRRYLVIELACGRPLNDQMATLGHELHHALEIADQPSVVDPRSLAALYKRIGIRTTGFGPAQMFETAGAREAALQVRREVWGRDVRLVDEK
jgi:hypothetical protein